MFGLVIQLNKPIGNCSTCKHFSILSSENIKIEDQAECTFEVKDLPNSYSKGRLFNIKHSHTWKDCPKYETTEEHLWS